MADSQSFPEHPSDRSPVGVPAPPAAESDTSPPLDRILLRALLEHLPDSIYFKDRQSRFIRVNTAKANKTGGRCPKELVGQSDFDHFTAEHAQPAFDAEQHIIATGEPLLDCEEKETWADGHVSWVSTTKLPLRDLDGAIIPTFLSNALSSDVPVVYRHIDQLAPGQVLVSDIKLSGEVVLVAAGERLTKMVIQRIYNAVTLGQIKGPFLVQEPPPPGKPAPK